MTKASRPPRILKPDPSIEPLLAFLRDAPALSSYSPGDARAVMLAAAPMFYPPQPPGTEERSSIAGVPVRIYRGADANPSRPAPALLYFHGGGWVMGDMDGFAPISAALANDAQITVISVDYALAPESPFPAALNQGIAVADALFADGERHGVDSRRLAIGGDSAGGNLAAVIAIDRRERGLDNFAHQLLLYPVTDCRLNAPSYDECGSGYMLSHADMAWFRSHYLPEGTAYDDWRVSPLLADSLVGLPAAHVLTCGLDPLQDDGRAYADALERAGVDVSRQHYSGMLHGFLFMGKAIPAVAPALRAIADVLRHALHRSGSDSPPSGTI